MPNETGKNDFFVSRRGAVAAIARRSPMPARGYAVIVQDYDSPHRADFGCGLATDPKTADAGSEGSRRRWPLRQRPDHGIDLPGFDGGWRAPRRRIGERAVVVPAAGGVVGRPPVAEHGVIIGGAWRRPGDGDLRALNLHHVEKARGIARGEPNAAVRDGTAERCRLISAMDRIAADEKDGIGHRRHMIFVRIMRALQLIRPVSPARRAVAATCRA